MRTTSSKDFTDEFHRMWKLIISKTPMAYARYADGEVALMQGRKVGNNSQAFRVDRWSSEDGFTILGQDLLDTLYHTEPNYYYAISCKCCDPMGQAWLLDHIKQSTDNITYSNLWINANYKLFINEVCKLKAPVYIICNKRGAAGRYPFDVNGFYPIKDDCVKNWETNKEKIITDMKIIAEHNHGQLFLLSAGPLSEVLIHHLWNFNPYNSYIDVGSAIDEFVHLNKTRPFMIEGNHYYSTKCQF